MIVLFTSSFSVTAQPKGYLYDESKVAPYELPDPMVCLDGTKVTDSKTWLKKRRPEVLRLFEEEVYGRSPGKPKEMRFEVVEEGVESLGGNETRKQS
ncbi:MAG: acetylxylan esterase, partial [Opitutae bacterium]